MNEESKLKSKYEMIHAKLQLMKEEAKNDTFIDKGQLFNPQTAFSQFNLTMKTIKWQNRRTEWTEIFRHYDGERKEKKKKLWEFYKTEYPIKIDTKQEMDDLISADTEYRNLFNMCDKITEVIKFIDDTRNELKNMGWEMNRIIEWHKFINGK